MSKSNVYRLKRARVPEHTEQCLQRLLTHAAGGLITGVAFVAYMDGNKYIADACGEAKTRPGQTRILLRTLDAKLARLPEGP